MTQCLLSPGTMYCDGDDNIIIDDVNNIHPLLAVFMSFDAGVEMQTLFPI